eukprot:1160021-Pelagomonas_calceolata.AAC.9
MYRNVIKIRCLLAVTKTAAHKQCVAEPHGGTDWSRSEFFKKLFVYNPDSLPPLLSRCKCKPVVAEARVAATQAKCCAPTPFAQSTYRGKVGLGGACTVVRCALRLNAVPILRSLQYPPEVIGNSREHTHTGQ